MASIGSILKTPTSIRKMPTQSNHVKVGYNDSFDDDRDPTSHWVVSSTPFSSRYSTPFKNNQAMGSSWTTPTPSINRMRKDLNTPITDPNVSVESLLREQLHINCKDVCCTPPPVSGFPQARPLYAGVLDSRLLRNTLGTCKAIKLYDDPSSPVQFRFSPFSLSSASRPQRASTADKEVQTSPLTRRNGGIPNSEPNRSLQKVQLKRKRLS